MDIQLTPGLALDIDETISITFPIWIGEMLQHFGNPENLTVEEFFAKNTHHVDVPYWNKDEVEAWLEQKYFEPNGYKTLPLMPNANHVVNKINEIVPISCYITARPESLRDVTREWLKQHDFPQRPIIMKPLELGRPGHNVWKQQVLVDLFPTVHGIIDDNPGLIDELPEEYSGTVFLFNKETHNSTKQLNIITCRDWNDVYLKVTSNKL